MKKRVVRKSKPLFKKRRTPARTALNIVLTVLLLVGLAFLGYSVGKPIMKFVQDRDGRPSQTENRQTEEAVTTAEPTVTTAPTEESAETTEEPEPEPIVKKNILFVSAPSGAGFDSYLDERIAYASENGYMGIAVDLLSDGGMINFATANERALLAEAVLPSGISSLAEAVGKINDAGLKAYARLSLLTDHKLSYIDKGVCYLFENSTSSWYDNSVSNGGKPWISAFSESAREYISGIAKEISDAGFEGIIAGEIEFPPFRRSDLSYVGAMVQSADRYTALVDFSNAVQSAVSQKEYYPEIDAQDIIAGSAEVLKGADSLNFTAIYIKYDSAAVGERIVKSDETEVSYTGLSPEAKATVVFRSVAQTLSGKKIIPAITDRSLIPTLVELGYDETEILIY